MQTQSTTQKPKTEYLEALTEAIVRELAFIAPTRVPNESTVGSIHAYIRFTYGQVFVHKDAAVYVCGRPPFTLQVFEAIRDALKSVTE